MQDPFAQLVGPELAQAITQRLNAKNLYMNPRTGTVQTLDLWHAETDRENPEPFVKSELVAVKMRDGQWVRVN
jgi:hypothetical protein